MGTKCKFLIASLIGLAIAGGLWFWHRPAPAVAVTPAAPPVAATQQAAAPSPRQQEATTRSPASLVLRPSALPQSPLVAKLLSSDSVTRNAALRSLTRNIATNDVATLVAFLESPPGNYAGLRPIVYNAVRNDVLDVLLRQDKPVPGLGTRLVVMMKDPAQDDVWRDYCVQYLAPYYTTTWPAKNEELSQGGGRRPGGLSSSTPRTTNALASEQEAILSAYWESVAQSNKSVAGTALIGLETLSRQYPEVDKDRLGREAAALADDELASEPARITALRICGMLKRHEALETVRITSQAGTTVLLRMAAIATLGELGEQQDLEYLQSVAPSETPRMKPVMEAAMKAIRGRLGRSQG